jgi:hypothetical protein
MVEVAGEAGTMGQVRHLPSSLKFKVGWLVAAFVVVWVNAPGDPGSVRADGLPLGTPTAALASAPSVDVDGASTAGPDDPSVVREAVRVRLDRGRTAEHEGVRLGVLAVVDEPVPASLARQVGERQIWVFVALKNVGSREITYTALDLELTDGRSVHSSFEGRRGPGALLRFGALAPGESVSGWRVFRVPESAGPFDLVYTGPSAS